MALSYQVAIISVWWKKGGLDVRFFDTKANQKQYFDNLITSWSNLLNFNFNDNITTILTFLDSSSRDIETLLKCNYAILKDKNNNYRYFFITSIRADSNRKVEISIDLDDINTNLVENQNNIGDVMLKNWTGNNLIGFEDSGVIKYNYDFTSNITSLIPEGDNPQLINKVTKEAYIKHSNLTTLNDWLNANIKAWRWLFVTDNNKLIAPYFNSQWYDTLSLIFNMVKLNDNNVTTLPYKTLCSPIYKENSTKKIYLKFNSIDYQNTLYLKLESVSLDLFFTLRGYIQGDSTLYENGPKGTYGITEKISVLGPLSVNNLLASQFEIDADGDLIVTCNNSASNKNLVNFNNTCFGFSSEEWNGTNPPTTKQTAYYGCLGGFYQTNTTYEIDFENPINMSNKTYLEAKNINTKILDSNYTALRLRVANQEYSYNPLAYFNNSTNKIEALYTEVVKVETTKIYLRLKNKNLYQNNETDYTGLVASLDLSEPLLTNQWADYLASHKNYYMQTAFNNTMSLAKNFIGAVSSKSDEKAMTRGLTSVMDYTSNLLNQKWERENMQQAPDGLSNANGDPYFISTISSVSPKLDLLEICDTDKQSILSKFSASGFAYNKIVNFNAVINQHINYDFISCNINKININISTKEYTRLYTLLSNGLRYWYNDNSSLNDVNYRPV